MMLEAADLGIGSCWVGYFNADQVAEALGLPENVTVSALLHSQRNAVLLPYVNRLDGIRF